MAIITDYLERILSARYGKDVRQSIHDGIKAINDEVAADKNAVVESMNAAEQSKAEAEKQAQSAQESASNAASSATTSGSSANSAQTSASNAAASASAAKTSETNAKTSETAAAQSVTTAKGHADTAGGYAAIAEEKANSAASHASSAETDANTARQMATLASTSADTAVSSAGSASDSATESKSYARGGTGTRDGEDADNAKYYYEQTKQISQGINGVVPMGTVTFANLPTENIVDNAMYNVSDAFTSDSRFNDGGGIYYGPGNNVIWTAEGKWDVTASSTVTGIKGAKESTYRQGNVNITPENIGAPTEEAFADLLAKVGATNISHIGNGTTTGAISHMYDNLMDVNEVVEMTIGETDISEIGDGTLTGGLVAVDEKAKENAEKISTVNESLNASITVAENGEHRANIANAIFAEGGGGLTCKWGADEDNVWKLFIYIGGTLVGKLPIMTLESSIANINSDLSSLLKVQNYQFDATFSNSAESITEFTIIPPSGYKLLCGVSTRIFNANYIIYNPFRLIAENTIQIGIYSNEGALSGAIRGEITCLFVKA